MPASASPARRWDPSSNGCAGMKRMSGAACGWYGCHSFVVAKLTGEYVLDHHTASQCDPLYRVPEFDWHHDWASEICQPLPLPRLAWPGRSSARFIRGPLGETGLAVGTPVVAGTIDAFAEAFSVGVRDPGI